MLGLGFCSKTLQCNKNIGVIHVACRYFRCCGWSVFDYCCCCHANMQSVPLASSRMRRIRAVFVLVFFQPQMERSSLLYSRCGSKRLISSPYYLHTDTESSTHWHTPLGWAANSVPKWICLFFFSICLMTASPGLYFSHFIPLFYSFSVALIHFQRQQHSWFYCQFLSLSLWPNMVLQAPTLLGITALLAFA